MKPYYEDALVTLYHGDALEVMSDLTEPIDLLLTDPPYFQPVEHYVNARGVAPIRSLGDTSILSYAFKSWATEMARLIAPSGSGYIFCDGQSYPILFNAFYSLGRVRPLIWDKVTSFNGYTWRHQHELIAWLERPDAARVPTGDGDILKERAVPVKERIHPAQKPVPLLERLLLKHDAGLVLEPFAGGGSSLVAAANAGRKAIGIEIEERYCEVIANRLQTEVRQRQLTLDVS